MKRKKILAISIVCVLLVGGGSVGGAAYYKKSKNEKRVVNVTPVVNMMGYDYGSEKTIDGTVITGSKQNVMLEKDQVVQSVLVKKGDKVKVGTPLIAYDTTALKLAVQEKKNAVDAAEDDLRQARKELERLQSLHPAEDQAYDMIDDYDEPEEPDLEEDPTAGEVVAPVFPTTEPTTTDETEPTGEESTTESTDVTEAPTEEPTQPDDGHLHSIMKDASQGDGSMEKPYDFYCESNTIVGADLLLELQQSNSYARFIVPKEGYRWLIQGSALPETLTDWAVNQGVSVAEDGMVSVDFKQVSFGIFQMQGTGGSSSAEDWGFDEDVDFGGDDWSDDSSDGESEDYMYSAQELSNMIQKQQSKIKTLEFTKKSADLDYEVAQKKQDDGMERSLIDGVVTEIHSDLTEKEAETKPYLVIQGSGGLQVKGTISEWNLNQLQVGTEIQAMSYDTGDSFTMTVTGVDDIPATDGNVPYVENPSSSVYTFEAETSEQHDIAVGSWLSLSLQEAADTSTFYLPLQYVRKENGQYYVMKANDQNRLEKQWIQTGKIRYGSEIEIKSGVSETDRLCFPYGKDVKEGVRTKDTDEVQW
ncbi:MAG: hypothetical protein UGF38_04310 [Ruminococcus sp.]|nr:hypothetical protein [Ruminococcus sp.]